MSRQRRKPSCVVILLVLVLLAGGLFVLLNWVIMPAVVGRQRVVVVPNLVGLDRFAAEETINRYGLRLTEIKPVTTSETAPDRVVAQQPPAGARVKAGRGVRLDVSWGAGVTRVPRVSGLPYDQAMSLLSAAGLRLRAVESLRTQSFPAGQVVGTLPPAGTQLKEGDSITIQVSANVSNFPMPSLVGMDLETARGLVLSQGLTLAEVREAESDESPGLVIFQYPEEGVLVAPGDSVGLIVARPR